MEFVLPGRSADFMISKKVFEGKIEFKDMTGSRLHLGGIKTSDEDDDSEDFR